MLGHAITAKTAKLNKKLKMIDLQLKKAKLDQVDAPSAKIPSAEGRMLDRNDLLRQLQQDAEKTNDGK
jgi:vancomycin resistance protein YoaR